MTICAGTRFGRYEILDELGRGAMGVVYQARDPQIDRLVALKTISLDTQDPDDAAAFRSRFFHEARAAGRLSHPGIVQVFDVGEEPSTRLPYLVMELIPGRSLNQHINAAGGKLPLEVALGLAEQVAEALGYAHSQSVVHRDIKPSNILITPEKRAKITDFGIARLDKTNMTVPGQVFGTPSYMAPEQLTGEAVDGRADLFALGVILYLMLCGHKPFQGLSNRTVRHNVVHHTPVPVSALDLEISPEVAAIVRRAIEKDPARRYQTGTEMALAIQRIHDFSAAVGAAAITAKRDSTATGSRVLFFNPGFGSALVTVTQPSEKADTPDIIATLSRAEPKRMGLVFARTDPKAVPLAMCQRRRHNSRVLLEALAVGTIVLAGYIAIHHLHASTDLPVSGEVSNQSASTSPATPHAVAASSTATADNSPRQKSVPPVSPSSSSRKSSPTPLPEQGNSAHAGTGTQRAPKAPVRDRAAERRPTIALQPKATPQFGAALSVDIDHSFDHAQVDIWIDNGLAFTGTLRGEQKKRFGLLNRTQGKQSTRVNVSPGEHRIRVRIHGPGFDESRLVAQTFNLNAGHTLHIKCDKHNNDLHLRFD